MANAIRTGTVISYIPSFHELTDSFQQHGDAKSQTWTWPIEQENAKCININGSFYLGNPSAKAGSNQTLTLKLITPSGDQQIWQQSKYRSGAGGCTYTFDVNVDAVVFTGVKLSFTATDTEYNKYLNSFSINYYTLEKE